MAPSIDKPGMSAQEAATINAAAVTRNYSVKPRLQYQTVSAVSGEPQPQISEHTLTLDDHRPSYCPGQCQGTLLPSIPQQTWADVCSSLDLARLSI
jgi:hypothetical protein